MFSIRNCRTMNKIRTFCLLLAGVVMMPLTSCFKDELAEPVEVNVVLASQKNHLVPCRAGDAEKSAIFSASIAVCNEI